VRVAGKDALASMKRGKLYATPDGLLFLVGKSANFQRDLSPNYAKILRPSLISSEEISCSSFYIPEQVRRWCKSRTRPQHEVILQQPYAQGVYQIDRNNLDPYRGKCFSTPGSDLFAKSADISVGFVDQTHAGHIYIPDLRSFPQNHLLVSPKLMKGTKEFSNYPRATFCEQHSLGPPPINYATHPKRAALTLGGTSTTSTTKVVQSASAPVPAAPSAYTSRSGSLPAIDIDLELLELILDPTPPSPDAPSSTSTATAPSTTLDGQAQTVDSLTDVLDGLSIDDTTQPPPFVPASPAPTAYRRRPRSKYYSVTVGKCCGVFQRW